MIKVNLPDGSYYRSTCPVSCAIRFGWPENFLEQAIDAGVEQMNMRDGTVVSFHTWPVQEEEE